MTTPVYLTGFEHGNLSTSGSGIANTVTGDTTVQTTTKRTGTYALKCAPTGAAAAEWGKNLSTPTGAVVRVYVYVSSAPASSNAPVLDVRTTTGSDCRIKISATNFLIHAANTLIATGPAYSINTWYRIDFYVDVSANPWRLKAKIDGGTEFSGTNAEAADTITAVRCGSGNSTGPAYTAYFDDFIMSTTLGDYPIGAGQVVKMSPDADGAHNAGTNVMEDSAGTDIGVTPAWSLLDDVPMGAATTTDRVQQSAVGTGNYAEVTFANMPSSSAINGVMGLLCYQSATTSTNQGATIVSADSFATFSDVFGNPTTRGDMSETSDFFKSVLVAAPGGTWDEGEVNALKMRIGYSNDVSPVPYWLALMCEVDYVPAAGGSSIVPITMYQRRQRV